MNVYAVQKCRLNFNVFNTVFNYSIRFVQEIYQMNYFDLNGAADGNTTKKTSAYSSQVEPIIDTSY